MDAHKTDRRRLLVLSLPLFWRSALHADIWRCLRNLMIISFRNQCKGCLLESSWKTARELSESEGLPGTKPDQILVMLLKHILLVHLLLRLPILMDRFALMKINNLI